MFKLSLYIITLGLLFSSCHKDYESGEDTTTQQFLPEIKSQVEGSILGYVYDENNQPVEGALVEIYGSTTKTNKFGVFEFQKKALDELGTYIRISKPGYMTGSDKIFPAGGVAYSKTKLFSLHKNDKLHAPSGGEIKMKNGGKLVFPPKAIQDKNGNDYTGNVYVTSVFLSPDSPALSDEMPGDLLGGNEQGISSVLGTAGMFGVVLTGENSEKLQIKPDYKVKFFIPALSVTKPVAVPLWHFDENKGYWIEEGLARYINGQYIGEVNHFSFWNVDVPYPLIELCGNILSDNGKPILGIQISIEVEGLGVRHGYVDYDGKFCGLIPKDKKITLILKRHGCNEVLKQIEVGPFSAKTVLNPIILDYSTLSIEGVVTCENIPVQNGIVVIQFGQFTYHTSTDNGGRYSYQFYGCNNVNEVTVFAFDKGTNKASLPETIPIDLNTVKEIKVCEAGCFINGYIENKCDYLEMVISQGTGNVYKFLWSTSDTGTDSTVRTQNTLPLEPRHICVTVTDPSIANCKQVFCFNYEGRLKIFVESECHNPMMIFPSGGVLPYTYKWHNGKTTNEVVLSPGEAYCVTVTDKIGCNDVRCGTFEEIFLDNEINNCSAHTFDISSSPYSNAFLTVGSVSEELNSLTGLSLFMTGFNFGIYISQGQCSASNQYHLPQFKGLSIKEIEHTTCVGCTDGFIDVGIDATADCLNCVHGGVKIFEINNLNSDLSTLNNMRLMPKGEYYVVVEDANTNCYIAFKKVKVE